jgi:hypothetical protein
VLLNSYGLVVCVISGIKLDSYQFINITFSPVYSECRRSAESLDHHDEHEEFHGAALMTLRAENEC